MKFELPLLFALVGSFCTITHASTLVVPSEADLIHMTGASVPTQTADTLKAVTPEEVVTEAPALVTTEAAVKETEAPLAPTEDPVEETEVPADHTELQTEQTETTLTYTPEAPVEETEATVGVTEATAEKTHVTVVDNATEGILEDPEAGGKADAAETELINKAEVVEVEDSEGMSTVHVVGIVFAALVAVAIIIAIIVVVVRRMGQYSP